MRLLGLMVTVATLAVIVGSATTVIIKQEPPNLSLNIVGVPGYVYYDRAYDLTIEYANEGGAIDEPVRLEVQLPQTFALAEHVHEPARRGERLSWTFDGLDSGERGSIPITVRGVLPDDLSGAVYDLPGYEGHTAFVEGFDLEASLVTSGQTATAAAVADTGTVSAAISITKTVINEVNSENFYFQVLPLGAIEPPTCLELLNMEDGGTGACLVPGPATLFIDELINFGNGLNVMGPDWVLSSFYCEGPSADYEYYFYPLRNGGNTLGGAKIELETSASIDCFAYNSERSDSTGTIRVTKSCVNAGEAEAVFLLELVDSSSNVVGQRALKCGESHSFTGIPNGTYEVTETLLSGDAAGWELTNNGCESVTLGGPGGGDGTSVPGTEVINCTVQNTFSAPVSGESINVTKVCVNEDPQTFEIALYRDGVQFGSAQTVDCEGSPDTVTFEGLDDGDYQVVEFSDAAYRVTYGGDDCDTAGNFTVVSGEGPYSCQVTNTRLTGSGGDDELWIIKEVEGGSSQDFSFTTTISGCEQMGPLDDDDDPQLLDRSMCQDVAPGTYEINEQVPDGWLLTSVSCTEGLNAQPVFQSGNLTGVSVTVPDNSTPETWQCWFTNAPTGAPEDLASITIVKRTLGDITDEEFTLNTTIPGCQPNVGPLVHNGQAICDGVPIPGSFEDAYSITEDVPDGWVLADAFCTGDAEIDAVNNGDDLIGLRVWPHNGGNVICYFINARESETGSIEVTKDCLGAVTPAEGGSFPLFLRNSQGEVVGQRFVACTDPLFTVTWDNLPPGNYSVEEELLRGMFLADNGCTDVEVTTGETAECTITNRLLEASIGITKQTPAETSDTFDFTIEPADGSLDAVAICDTTTLDTDPETAAPAVAICHADHQVGGEPEAVNVEYTVTEAQTPGWVLVDVTCQDENPDTSATFSYSDVLDPLTDALIGVSFVASTDVGEARWVECIFQNEEAPPLTISKSSSRSVVYWDEQFEYEIVISNTSGETIDGFSVTDSLDGSATLLSVQPEGGDPITDCVNEDGFDCEFGALGPDETLTLIVTVENGQGCGPIENTASVRVGEVTVATAEADPVFSTVLGECSTVPVTVVKDCNVQDEAVVFRVQLQTEDGRPVGDEEEIGCGDTVTWDVPSSDSIETTYSVVETYLPEGWAEVSNGCDELVAGDSSSDECTIENERLEQDIVVTKLCAPFDDTASFTIGLYYEDEQSQRVEYDRQSVGCGDDAEFTDVPTDHAPYYVEETIPDDAPWAQTSTDCAENGLTPVSGQTVSCTIENTLLTTIEIEKVCNTPDDPGTFEVRIRGVNGTDYSHDTEVTCESPVLEIPLLPGNYEIDEQFPESPASGLGEEKYLPPTYAGCDIEIPPFGDEAPSEQPTYRCVITNELMVGEVTIEVDVEPYPDPFDFSYTHDFYQNQQSSTVSLLQVAASAIGNCDLIVLDDDGDPELENSITCTLPAGSYQVTQDQAAGYHLVEIDCSALGSEVSGSASGDAATRTASIDLQANDAFHCVFYNQRLGSIEIAKEVPGTDPEAFSFSDDIPGCEIGALADNLGVSVPQTALCENVVPGTYTVTEATQSGWELDNIVCEDADSSGEVADRTASILLQPGEHVRCTFYNVPVSAPEVPATSTLVIKKEASPATSHIRFTMNASWYGSFQLQHGASREFTGLVADTYRIAEVPLAGWALDSVTCNTRSYEVGNTYVDVEVGEGERVECVFKNVEIPTSAPQPSPSPSQTPSSQASSPEAPSPAVTTSPTPTPASTTAPAEDTPTAPGEGGAIVPPSTGDGGISTGAAIRVTAVMIVLAAVLAGTMRWAGVSLPKFW